MALELSFLQLKRLQRSHLVNRLLILLPKKGLVK